MCGLGWCQRCLLCLLLILKIHPLFPTDYSPNLVLYFNPILQINASCMVMALYRSVGFIPSRSNITDDCDEADKQDCSSADLEPDITYHAGIFHPGLVLLPTSFQVQCCCPQVSRSSVAAHKLQISATYHVFFPESIVCFVVGDAELVAKCQGRLTIAER